MIIEPDFVDHWKTRLLVDLLGADEMAPIYLIRLWAHCQQRKTSYFDSLPTVALKAICRFPGDADAFEKALEQCGFVDRTGASLAVLGWDEYNASLIANWTNGGKGGRPKKVVPNNPTETHGLSMANPIGTDREEKIGEVKPIVASQADDILPTPAVAAPAKQDCPHQEIIAIYHEVLPQCPQVRDWTPTRATQLRARWNEDPKRQSLAYWRQFFEYVRSCDFLVGRAGKEPFFADLEWITKSGNFTKIREEKYANRK